MQRSGMVAARWQATRLVRASVLIHVIALLAVLLAAEDARVAGIALLSPTLRYDGSSIPWTRRLLPLAHVFPFFDLDGDDFGFKFARLNRSNRVLVAGECQTIHCLAGHFVLLGDKFGGVTHAPVFKRTP